MKEARLCIITNRVVPLLHDMKERLGEYQTSTRTGKLKNGREFFIATRSRDVMGKAISDVEVHSYGGHFTPRELKDFSELQANAAIQLQKFRGSASPPTSSGGN